MSGIEILGIAASVIQIADAGARLSSKLFIFTRKIKNADRTISEISQEIAATGAALRELGEALEQDKYAKLGSRQSIDTTSQIVADCWKVFTDINDTIGGDKIIKDGAKSDEKMSSTTTLARFSKPSFSLKQKLKFPYIEPQIMSLRSKLESLKSSLMLMLQVLMLAEQVRNRPQAVVSNDQKALIQILIAERNEKEKRFRTSCLTIENDSNRSTESGVVASEPASLKRASTSASTLSLLPEAPQSVLAETVDECPDIPKPVACIVAPSVLDDLSRVDSAGHFLPRQASTDTVSTRSLNSIPRLTPTTFMDTETKAGAGDLPAALRIRQEEIQHHAQLVQNLLEEISDVQYRIDHGIRHRMHDGVLKIHWDEWSPYAQKHGHDHFLDAFEKSNHRHVSKYWLDQDHGHKVPARLPSRIQGQPPPRKGKSIIKFLDAIQRVYNLPFEGCQRWEDMQTMINESFLHVEGLYGSVKLGRYDLVGPDGSIILPKFWQSTVEPGMEIKMLLWPLPEALSLQSSTPLGYEIGLGGIGDRNPQKVAKRAKEKGRTAHRGDYEEGDSADADWLERQLRKKFGVVFERAHPDVFGYAARHELDTESDTEDKKPRSRRPAPVQMSKKTETTERQSGLPFPARLSSQTVRAFLLIADELDTDPSELSPEAVWEDMGLDSLMALTITARLRDELQIDIPSAIFEVHPTAGALLGYLHSAYPPEQGVLPGLNALKCLKVGEGGAVKDDEGNTLGKITEGDPADLVGKTLNAEGEVLDEDGDVVGRAEIVPRAADVVGEVAEADKKFDDHKDQPQLTTVHDSRPESTSESTRNLWAKAPLRSRPTPQGAAHIDAVAANMEAPPTTHDFQGDEAVDDTDQKRNAFSAMAIGEQPPSRLNMPPTVGGEELPGAIVRNEPRIPVTALHGIPDPAIALTIRKIERQRAARTAAREFRETEDDAGILEQVDRRIEDHVKNLADLKQELGSLQSLSMASYSYYHRRAMGYTRNALERPPTDTELVDDVKKFLLQRENEARKGLDDNIHLALIGSKVMEAVIQWFRDWYEVRTQPDILATCGTLGDFRKALQFERRGTAPEATAVATSLGSEKLSLGEGRDIEPLSTEPYTFERPMRGVACDAGDEVGVHHVIRVPKVRRVVSISGDSDTGSGTEAANVASGRLSRDGSYALARSISNVPTIDIPSSPEPFVAGSQRSRSAQRRDTLEAHEGDEYKIRSASLGDLNRDRNTSRIPWGIWGRSDQRQEGQPEINPGEDDFLPFAVDTTKREHLDPWRTDPALPEALAQISEAPKVDPRASQAFENVMAEEDAPGQADRSGYRKLPKLGPAQALPTNEAKQLEQPSPLHTANSAANPSRIRRRSSTFHDETHDFPESDQRASARPKSRDPGWRRRGGNRSVVGPSDTSLLGTSAQNDAYIEIFGTVTDLRSALSRLTNLGRAEMLRVIG